jgi:hypothetical protein
MSARELEHKRDFRPAIRIGHPATSVRSEASTDHCVQATLLEFTDPLAYKSIKQGMRTEWRTKAKLDSWVSSAQLVARGGQVPEKMDTG